MKKRFVKLLAVSLALTLLFSANGAFAASAEKNKIHAYVVADTMKVYQYPSPLSKLLGVMSYGEDVMVLAWKDGWMRVQNRKGQIGYCEIGSLSQNDPRIEVFGYVKESGAYVYSKPSFGYKIIAKVSMGDELKVVGMTRDKAWLRVQNGEKFGYVRADLVSKSTIWPDSSTNVLA